MNKHTDGKPFTQGEQATYDTAFALGQKRAMEEMEMGSSHQTGHRGRKREIFQFGLEMGYKSVDLCVVACAAV